jgi:hypothetical protein
LVVAAQESAEESELELARAPVQESVRVSASVEQGEQAVVVAEAYRIAG